MIKLIAFFLLVTTISCEEKASIIDVGLGWAKNSVNTVVFRKNSLFTHDGIQYITYYNGDRKVVVGKRKSNSEQWELVVLPFEGNTLDAHNVISMIVDGDGYIHLSWDHHNTILKYAKSIAPGVLEFRLSEMLGNLESAVTYPEFYAMPNGDVMFFYRDGGAGNGDLIINRYRTKDEKWERVQDNLISGENLRNAYWQSCVDTFGQIHISWVWRESSDVASNHDLSYAKSTDGGTTWQNSLGKLYELPITLETVEVIQAIPQKSELINQTSMTATPSGLPLIASYWTPQGLDVPQFHLIAFDGTVWHTQSLEFRTEPFSLSGQGTKAIPISRPQIVASNEGVWIIFRDAESENKIMMAQTIAPEYTNWTLIPLTISGYPAWEPTLDPSLWKSQNELNLFLQNVSQVDHEGVAKTQDQMIQILQWKP